MPAKEKTDAQDVGEALVGAALTGVNYIGSLTGWWGDFHQNSTLSKLSPEENARRVSEYRTSLGFDLNATTLPSKELFNAYAEARTPSVNSFSKVTGPDGKPIADKLKEPNEGGAAAGTAIATALKLSNKTETARTKFKKDMERVEEAIKNPQSEFHPGHMVSYMHELKSDAHAVISAQHAEEKKNLIELFNDEAFLANLTRALETTPDQNNKIKQDILSSLEQSQKKELEDFDKGMKEPLNKMHNAAQIENSRVAYLAQMYEHNAQMKKEIDKLYKQNQHKDAGAELVIGQEKGFALFKNMKLTDLPFLETVTGRKMHKQPAADGTVSFRMQLPYRFLSPGYYHGSSNRLKADLLSMAGAIRATGSETIIMSVQEKNQDKALELGRKSYEACLEAGFDPKKITINVNGQAKKADELFAEYPSRLNAARQKAGDNAKLTEDAAQRTGAIGYQRFKKDLTEGRLADAKAKSEARAKEEKDMGHEPTMKNPKK
jgi:hypothetical protein